MKTPPKSPSPNGRKQRCMRYFIDDIRSLWENQNQRQTWVTIQKQQHETENHIKINKAERAAEFQCFNLGFLFLLHFSRFLFFFEAFVFSFFFFLLNLTVFNGWWRKYQHSSDIHNFKSWGFETTVLECLLSSFFNNSYFGSWRTMATFITRLCNNNKHTNTDNRIEKFPIALQMMYSVLRRGVDEKTVTQYRLPL